MGRRSPLEVAPGKIVQRFTPEQTRDLCSQWEAAFPASRTEIHVEQFLWHVFSYERYPSVSLEAALAEYRKHPAAEYLILTNDQREGVITDQRPEDVSTADYLVCPRNWAWTMAFTHEDGWLGPYFARHRNFGKLQAANSKAVLDALRKQQEKDLAKQKGWA